MQKKQIIIFFPDPHLAHSPTLLNLIELLKTEFNVALFYEAFSTNTFFLDEVELVPVKTKRISNHWHFRIARIIDGVMFRLIGKKFVSSALHLIDFKKNVRRHSSIISRKNSIFIGVDYIGAFTALGFTQSFHFISLEIYPHELMHGLLLRKKAKIGSMLIQSIDRLELFIANPIFEYFLIQNAPRYRELKPKKNSIGTLIYLGSFLPKMGSELILKFAEAYDEYRITIKGIIPDKYAYNLPENVMIDGEYTSQEDLQEYLSEYHIGLCLYDFSYVNKKEFNHFKHLPSGKMYNYFNAGIPVIGVRCAGLNPVEKFNAGLLLDDLKPVSIKQALIEINKNYDYYVAGCKKAARHFDFDRNAQEYLDFLKLQ